MTPHCIITAADTGSPPSKRDGPVVSIGTAKRTASTQVALEAGATRAHRTPRWPEESSRSARNMAAGQLSRVKRQSCRDYRKPIKESPAPAMFG